MAGELGQQTVELGTMVRCAAEESYLALRELVERSRAEAEAEAQGMEGVRLRSDTEKKIDLLKFVDRTRQRMLRLHVLAKWCQQAPLVNYCQQLASTLSSHETCFTQTADSMFFMHDRLQQALAPIFDIPFATEVLRTRSYRRLPKCIEEIGTLNALSEDEQRYTLKKLNTLVRAKLLEESVPKEISEVLVTDGIANLCVDGEFRVLLTLGYRGHFSLWRLLHMELLVGERAGPIMLEETRRYALGDDIERRMANTDNPLMILYTVLHELCISLVMDTVIRQANVLRHGRWKDVIRSELISDVSASQGGNYAPVQLGQDGELDQSGFWIPGLKLNYWLDESSNASLEPDLSPFIRIEAGRKNMPINCIHSSFILDPLTDEEADLSIDLSCIDVEALIFKAIACNRHTRLLEIQKELNKNVQISQSPTDVVLKREVHVADLVKRMDERKLENSCANEVLQIRAYGQSYIHLGINIRSGRLLLQSSKNILLPSVLSESEEALNKGSLTASEVFVSLRTRSILHLFAAIGRFLGLKFLEEFVNEGEVASFLDSIRLTAGPLLALSVTIRPAKMPMTMPTGYSSVIKQNNFWVQGAPANESSSTNVQSVSAPLSPTVAHSNNQNLQSFVLSGAGRGGPGLIPSSSLPFDVTVVLRGPYWIRVIYRKIFSIDMRCFNGDQVWLQPATPPKGGPSVGGSLPCPQFQPFIMEHVAQGLNAFDPGAMSGRYSGAQLKANVNTASGSQESVLALNHAHGAHSVSISRPTKNVGNQVSSSFTRAGSGMVASKKYASGIAGAHALLSPGTNLPVHMKGDLSSAFTGLGDDGGYGGAWVPLAALKKVLRSILKYLGVLWLFSQFPGLLKEILGSVLSENEAALLNLDQEQPALRFFVGGYVFAVSVQRAQLLLQVLNVKRFHHQQQKQQQQALALAQEELATSEINEICDYFSRRVACEPYDASRVASFITLLTLPIPVLQEFISLIAWKKSKSQAHGENASAQRAQRVWAELSLEKHQGSVSDDHAEGSSSSKSNMKHDRPNHSVDFGLTFVLDHALKHHSTVGGAAWLPYCVFVRLRYIFGENGNVLFLAMDGSHGGKACWLQYEDWERCKQTVARAVEAANGSPSIGETGQGRLRLVAEMIHKQLHLSLQLRDTPLSAS